MAGGGGELPHPSGRTGAASKLTPPLDALGELAAADHRHPGAQVLSRRPARRHACHRRRAALLTGDLRTGRSGARMSRGFPADINAMEFTNGQGIVGPDADLTVTALNGPEHDLRPELASNPEVVWIRFPRSSRRSRGRTSGHALGLDVKKRDWTPTTRGPRHPRNQASSPCATPSCMTQPRSHRELKKPQEALQAAPRRLDLNPCCSRCWPAPPSFVAQIGLPLLFEYSGKAESSRGLRHDSKTAENLALGWA